MFHSYLNRFQHYFILNAKEWKVNEPKISNKIFFYHMKNWKDIFFNFDIVKVVLYFKLQNNLQLRWQTISFHFWVSYQYEICSGQEKKFNLNMFKNLFFQLLNFILPLFSTMIWTTYAWKILSHKSIFKMFCHNRIPVACKVSDFLDLITFSIMYTVEKEFDTFAESTSLFCNFIQEWITGIRCK